MARKKVLLVEVNEITWNLIDPWMEQGKLPTFAYLKCEGVSGVPMSVDLPPQLDPWITWTTVYTGRPQSAHNVFFLEQPPETIRAQRIWEYCHEQGLRVGVYGSLCSWPPQCVDGFYVPDTFAPDASTWPASLQPIQTLNLTYTRSIRLPSDQDGPVFKAKLAGQLLRLGLRPETLLKILRQLALERVKPETRWQRVALQPFTNFDFFSRLYRRYRPEVATFHTNHVAHYMHTYWKAMQPDAFPQKTSDEEMRVYGGAVEYGYRTADDLLRRMLGLIDNDTVLAVASSMGQKPFLATLQKGRPIKQLRSVERLLEILGVKGVARALPTMSDQFNIYPDTAEIGEAVAARLKAAYVDVPGRPMFSVDSVEHNVTATVKSYDELTESSRCYFPHSGHSFRYEDLVYVTGLVKSGCHDPKGMMLLYGPGIRRGGRITECNNLDIAPTLLTLLGLPVPPSMNGRVLDEAFAAHTGGTQKGPRAFAQMGTKQ